MDYAKNELKYGYPDDEATNFGPVVSDEHRDKVLSYYKLAEEEGAEVLHAAAARRSSVTSGTAAPGSNPPSGRASPTTAGWPPRRSSDLPLR